MSPVCWPCHACGEWRNDEWISVAHRKVIVPTITQTVQLNARYCNDRPDCLRKVVDVLDGWAVGMFGGPKPPAIHVLFGGRALCSNVNGVPGGWPEGNTWVRVEEVELSTCSDCKAAAAQQFASRRG